jgi:aminocarboxymuconate-semialdehyde decarboxylase
MSASRGVDVHTHLIPALDSAQLAIAGMTTAPGGAVARGTHAIGPKDLYRPELLEAWLAEHALESALVSIPPPMYAQGLGPVTTPDWVRSLNRGLHDLTAPHSMLEPLGYLPLDEPAAALSELELLSTEGWVGLTAAAGGRSVALDDLRLEPLWARLAELRLPMLLHPGASPDERLRHHYLENLLGNPQESTLAVGQLLFGGVLVRHPGLRFVVVHGGAFVPAVGGRWQRGVDTARPGLEGLAGLSVRDELRKSVWVDCLTHDATMLNAAATYFGEDRVLFGSDWPFPMGLDTPMTVLDRGPVTRNSTAQSTIEFLAR